MNLLEEEAAERLDSRAQECAVERNVDAFERDSGETALEIDGFGFGLGLLGTLPDYFYQMRFDFFEGHFLCERLDIHFLSFEIVGDISKAVQSTQLE